MPETVMVLVPAAEEDSYWLDVEVPSGSPGSAGYVHAVVVSSAAGPEDRHKAEALAKLLDVDVRNEQVPGVQPSGPGAGGIEFSQQAGERLRSPFSHGASEGSRRPR